MKATINRNGVLIIKAKNDFEMYALQKWRNDNSPIKSGNIIFDWHVEPAERVWEKVKLDAHDMRNFERIGKEKSKHPFDIPDEKRLKIEPENIGVIITKPMKKMKLQRKESNLINELENDLYNKLLEKEVLLNGKNKKD